MLSLVNQSETKNTRKLVNDSDLQGFWEMIKFQVSFMIQFEFILNS